MSTSAGIGDEGSRGLTRWLAVQPSPKAADAAIAARSVERPPIIACGRSFAQTAHMPDEARSERQLRALKTRLVDLEVRHSFQQQTIDDLDLVIREFSGRVEHLEEQLRQLRASSNEHEVL